MSPRHMASGSEFETFGQLLKYCRRRAQLTQSELAIACGYSTPHISHLENDQRLPDESTLRALFVPALGLQDEPELAEQLVDLAKRAHAAHVVRGGAQAARLPLPANLPYWSTAFIGRADELAKIAEMLDDSACKLLTLVGPGGTGKTRLALQVAAARNTRYTHGVHFVPLAPVPNGNLLPLAITNALNVVFYGQQDASLKLCEYLHDKQMLLVLDNFEHMLDGAALLTRILESAPAVQILVTSRERLKLSGEHVFGVGGINYPKAVTGDQVAYDALRLFEQEAKRVNPDFKLTERDIPAVIEIVRFVEGMPLGLLLAAGWVEVLTVKEIAREIQKNLDFLETQIRDVPERQRSMRATFQHSWKLLSEADRDAYSRLSVFRDGFTREAAQAVARADLRQLTALFNKSLVRRDPDTGRYEIHELLRRYAGEQLQKRPEAAATHAAYLKYYGQLLARSESDLKGSRQVELLSAFDAEFENVRNVWLSALNAGEIQIIDEMVECLYWYLLIRARLGDLRQLIEAALPRVLEVDSGIPGRTWARLQARTSTERSVHNFDHALAVALESKDGIEAALCRLRQSEAANDFENNPLAAIEYGTQALQAFVALDEAFYAGEACGILSLAYMNAGQLQQSIDMAWQAMEFKKQAGDPHGIAQATLILAAPDFLTGHFERSESTIRQSYDLHYELGQWAFALYSITLIGYIQFFRGDFNGLRALSADAQQLALQMDRDAGSAANILASLVALVDQDYAKCKQLISESPSINLILDLGSKWIGALAAWALGDIDALRDQAGAIVTFAIEAPFVTITAITLLVGLPVQVAEGRLERATALLAKASMLPGTGSGLLDHLPLTLEVRASLEAQLGPVAFAAAWERGKAQPVEALIEELCVLLADQPA